MNTCITHFYISELPYILSEIFMEEKGKNDKNMTISRVHIKRIYILS